MNGPEARTLNSTTDAVFDLSPSPSPMLKSKRTSSTVGSVREEHEHRGPSAKLRLYFGGGKRNTGSSGNKAGSAVAVPHTPTSAGMKSPCGYGHGLYSSRRDSDVMVLGYGRWTGGRAEEGGVTPTISDAGTDHSGMSMASGALGKRPIPVEIF